MKIIKESKIRRKIKNKLILTRKPSILDIFPPFEKVDDTFTIIDLDIKISVKVVKYDEKYKYFQITNDGQCSPREQTIPFSRKGYELMQKIYFKEVDQAISVLLGKYYNNYTISENSVITESDFSFHHSNSY